MKISTTLVVTILAASLSVGSNAHAASIVSDGDFTIPPGGATFTDYTAGNSFGPWTVTSGSVDLIGGYWQAPVPGGGSVDLDGSNPGGISQTLTNLNPGTYALTFSISGNPDGGIGTKMLDVSVGNVVSDPLSYTVTSANSHSNMLYATETIDFSVSGVGPQSTVLSFLSADPSGDYGPVIGDVSIAAVPLPAGVLLFVTALLGLAGVGYSRRRQTI